MITPKPTVSWRPQGNSFQGQGIDIDGFINIFRLEPNYPDRIPDVETHIIQTLDGSEARRQHAETIQQALLSVLTDYVKNPDTP